MQHFKLEYVPVNVAVDVAAVGVGESKLWKFYRMRVDHAGLCQTDT